MTPSAGADGAVVARLRAAGCVFAEDEARLLGAAADDPAHLEALVERRVGGEPLEHVLGWVEFCGLRIAVDPGVFVPRRRTEFLVTQAVAHLTAPGRVGRSVVVDLCCGSGAVAAAIAAACPTVALFAADLDPAAVACARRNLTAAGGRVFLGDLDEPLPAALAGGVDVLLANAPYVPTAAIPLLPVEAREHEPRLAVDGGVDGLDVLRRVVAAAPRWLGPSGAVLVESSEAQAPQLVAALGEAGLRARVEHCADLAATVVVGRRG